MAALESLVHQMCPEASLGTAADAMKILSCQRFVCTSWVFGICGTSRQPSCIVGIVLGPFILPS